MQVVVEELAPVEAQVVGLLVVREEHQVVAVDLVGVLEGVVVARLPALVVPVDRDVGEGALGQVLRAEAMAFLSASVLTLPDASTSLMIFTSLRIWATVCFLSPARSTQSTIRLCQPGVLAMSGFSLIRKL